MHRCLQISEILQAAADSFGEREKATLLRMSLTCQAFFDPAMNALWSTLREPEYLIRILPEDIITEENVDGQLQFTLARSPSNAEWQRFAEYARRVRVLDCPRAVSIVAAIASPLNPCSAPYWGAVLAHYPGTRILPNLHTLISQWELRFDHYNLLFHSPLRHLRLLALHEDAIGPLADALPNCASTLETVYIDITLRSHANRGRFAQRLSDGLIKLQKLVSQDIEIPCYQAIPHLASLPTLRELRLVDISGTGSEALLFPALEKLSIAVDNSTERFLLPFLSRLEAPVLRELKIRYDVRLDFHTDLRPTANEIHSILSNVSRFTHMRAFTLDGFELAAPPEDEHILGALMLAPLLALRELETLEMRGVPAILSSGDAVAMARAWPQLQCLRISDKVYFSAFPERTLLKTDDLLPFARFCPSLHTLGLPLEIEETSVRMGAPGLPPPSKLSKLSVSEVAEELSPEVLELFTRVFPSVYVKVPSGYPGASSELCARGDRDYDDEEWDEEEED